RAPHAGPAAATAEGLARLLVHADRVVAMLEDRGIADARVLVEKRPNDLLVAEEPVTQIGSADQRDIGTGHALHRAKVARHHVARCGDRIRHSAPSSAHDRQAHRTPSAEARRYKFRLARQWAAARFLGIRLVRGAVGRAPRRAIRPSLRTTPARYSRGAP